ncbi:MAG: hypothetical protein ACYSUM_16355 [Planctomycetota bacterium]|jgi:hypothetical protein
MRKSLLCLVVLGGALIAGDDLESAILARVKQLSVEEHADIVDTLRRELDKRLLTPPARWRRRVPPGEDSGVNRILNRGRFQGRTLVRGGGAYFSFTTHSNDYNREPDLELQQWRFTSGFAGGDYGLVEVAPVRSLAKVEMKHVPDLFKLPAQRFYTEGRKRTVEMRRMPVPPGLPRPSSKPEAVVGSVYVIRSVRWRESDLIAAFEVLERDEYGVTFAWKVLKRLSNPRRRR